MCPANETLMGTDSAATMESLDRVVTAKNCKAWIN